MDHEEMRAAYMRALNHKSNVFTSNCNICKFDYQENSGEIIDLLTTDAIYKVWYCEHCLSREDEYV